MNANHTTNTNNTCNHTKLELRTPMPREKKKGKKRWVIFNLQVKYDEAVG